MHRAAAPPAIDAIAPTEPITQAGLPDRWGIWLACALVAMANQADPPIWLLATSIPQESFGADAVRNWNIASTTTVFLLLFIVGGGVLGDLFGRRRVLLGGVTLFALAAGLSLLSDGMGWLIFSNGLLGIGAALTIPLALANIRLAFDPHRLPLALALYTAVGGLTSILVSTVGPLIRAQFGWRAIFLPPFLLAGVALWASRRHIPESRAEGSYTRSDAISVSAWSLVILPTAYAAIKIGTVGFFGWVFPVSLGVAVVGATLLVWQERRVPSPLRRSLPYPLRTLAIIILTGMVLNFALMGYTIHLYRFLRSALAFSAVGGAIALAPAAIGVGLTVLTAARLTRGRSPAVVIGGSLLVMAVAVVGTGLIVLLFQSATPYLLLAALLVTLVTGYLFAATAWSSAYLSVVPDGLVGVGAAISSGAAQLGVVLASTLLGTLLIGFGERDFAERLQRLGLSPEQTELARGALILAIQSDATFDPATLPPVLQATLGSYRDSYAVAFGQVLLLTAALLAPCAAIVWFGLRSLRPKAA